MLRHCEAFASVRWPLSIVVLISYSSTRFEKTFVGLPDRIAYYFQINFLVALGCSVNPKSSLGREEAEKLRSPESVYLEARKAGKYDEPRDKLSQ